MNNTTIIPNYNRSRTVQIISTNQPVQDISQHRLEFQYPKHWFAPVSLSPFSNQIEDETILWMQQLGLINNDASLSHVLAMEPRFYAGYSHSMASYEYALLYCKCVTMWLLWDDERVETAKKFGEIEGPIKALRGDSVSAELANDPYVKAFRHIGDEYERLGASKTWRQRFAESMTEWAIHAIQEERLRQNDSYDENWTFDKAISLRTLTIGLKPACIPLEQTAGVRFSNKTIQSEAYNAILDFASKICFIVNDIVGVPKDIAKNQSKSNLVLHYMNCNNVSLLDSYMHIIKIHDEAVLAYDELASDILRSSPSDKHDEMNSFFDYLRYMETGFTMWQAECTRYQNKLAVHNQVAYKIGISTI